MANKHKHKIGYLAIERTAHTALITMERAEKLNSMTASFWGDLCEALDMLAEEEEIRAVILIGAGDRAFSAGGDILGFQALKEVEDMRAYQHAAMRAFTHVERSPLIVIAAVNGLAYGGGCELALACDFVLAADRATFALPEAALGLVPGFGAIRAPEIIGRPMTKYLIATGDSIDASRALAIGMVQMVVPADRLLDEARAIANRIAARSPNAVSVAKRMVNHTINAALVDYSIEEITKLHATEDRARGVEAFLAKRAPLFRGRRPSGGQ